MARSRSSGSKPVRPDGGRNSDDVDERKVERGRQFYEGIGSFRDVLKIVLVIVALIALYIVFVQ